MASIYADVKDVVQRTTQSGTEPPSGVQGAGTIDRPYDQGNAPEQPSTQSKVEPPSGIQGRGTIDSPYDQGNAPEQQQPVAQATEPPSGIQGKGTIDQPYDQGNQPEQKAAQDAEPVSGVQGKGTLTQPYDQGNQPDQAASSGLPVRTVQATVQDPLSSPSTTHQGSGNPDMAPTKEQEQAIHESRGRDEAMQRTTSTPDSTTKQTSAPSRFFDASKAGAGQEAERMKYEERDVSPGEMRDGSHAVTSGEKGENYTPGAMNKLKDKFHIGRGRK